MLGEQASEKPPAAPVMNLRRSKTRRRNMKTWFIGVAIIVVAIGGLMLFLLNRPSLSPTHKNFLAIEKKVGFPLYYPASLPGYFFLDNGSINVSHDIVQFTIVQDGGQNIYVSEQALPANFNLNSITGTRATKPGVGTLVIGSGFLGYRAVIESSRTLTILTCSTSINGNDFATVVKELQSVN